MDDSECIPNQTEGPGVGKYDLETSRFCRGEEKTEQQAAGSAGEQQIARVPLATQWPQIPNFKSSESEAGTATIMMMQ